MQRNQPPLLSEPHARQPNQLSQATKSCARVRMFVCKEGIMERTGIAPVFVEGNRGVIMCSIVAVKVTPIMQDMLLPSGRMRKIFECLAARRRRLRRSQCIRHIPPDKPALLSIIQP
eukprot:gb/GEZN01011831.1/.p1 GENE.gb/GEZN01011831.1/~~gb/GEZN01011831.1/.p1  ORF type:complete len:117 (+),score=5.47 gb/GEZN01011831.1/:337-687(+)